MGTVEGGKKAAATNKRLYGEDFYRNLSYIGGTKRTANTKKKGFGSDPERARIAGRLGGSRSPKESKA